MEKRYKEIDGVRYQVIQNTILGSNVVPVGESLPEVTVSDSGKVLGVNSSGEWVPVDAPSDLPEVTSSDAGDVLTVNASGEWEAAAPGGGGGSPLLVNITTQDNIVFTMDKTYSEIKAAASSSGVLFIIDFPGEYTNIFALIGLYDEVDGSNSVCLPDLMGLTGGVSPYVYFTASSASGYPKFGEIE